MQCTKLNTKYIFKDNQEISSVKICTVCIFLVIHYFLCFLSVSEVKSCLCYLYLWHFTEIRCHVIIASGFIVTVALVFQILRKLWMSKSFSTKRHPPPPPTSMGIRSRSCLCCILLRKLLCTVYHGILSLCQYCFWLVVIVAMFQEVKKLWHKSLSEKFMSIDNVIFSNVTDELEIIVIFIALLSILLSSWKVESEFCCYIFIT